MAEQPSQQQSPRIDFDKTTSLEPSLSEASSSMKDAIAGFVGARVELAAIEAKEAAHFAGRKASVGILLAVCLLITWILLLAGIIGILAPLFDGALAGKADWLPGWSLALFIFAVLHAIVAAVFGSQLKKKPDAELFELSRKEIENDKQWLSKHQ